MKSENDIPTILDEEDAGAFHLVQFFCALPVVILIIFGAIILFAMRGLIG